VVCASPPFGDRVDVTHLGSGGLCADSAGGSNEDKPPDHIWVVGGDLERDRAARRHAQEIDRLIECGAECLGMLGRDLGHRRVRREARSPVHRIDVEVSGDRREQLHLEPALQTLRVVVRRGEPAQDDEPRSGSKAKVGKAARQRALGGLELAGHRVVPGANLCRHLARAREARSIATCRVRDRRLSRRRVHGR